MHFKNLTTQNLLW